MQAGIGKETAVKISSSGTKRASEKKKPGAALNLAESTATASQIEMLDFVTAFVAGAIGGISDAGLSSSALKLAVLSSAINAAMVSSGDLSSLFGSELKSLPSELMLSSLQSLEGSGIATSEYSAAAALLASKVISSIKELNLPEDAVASVTGAVVDAVVGMADELGV